MRRFVSFGPAFVVLIATLVVLVAAPMVVRRSQTAATASRIELASQQLDEENVLEAFNRATTALARKVMPSVVHIEVRGGSADSRRYGSSGSGWVYSAEGHVITNAHVVRGAEAITLEFADGRVVSATVVGSDPLTDIAVLRASSAEGMFPLEVVSGRLPVLGEHVYAFGSPFGFKFTMTEGMVSGLGREPNTPDSIGSFTNYVQHDAAVNPGNSGGPLVDIYGRVVGMNSAIATARGTGEPDDNTGDSAGISFAVPMGTLEPVVRQLIEGGTVRRGFLGINYGGPGGSRVARVEREDGSVVLGVAINSVSDGSPAEAGGLNDGDVIVSIDGYPVIGPSALRSLIASRQPGETVRIEAYRGVEVVNATVRLAEQPGEVQLQALGPRIDATLGMVVRNSRDGVVVVDVLESSPAYRAGIRSGTVIREVEGGRVSGFVDLYTRLESAGVLNGRAFSMTVEQVDPETQASTSRVVRVRPGR